ncbi:Protein FAR-RED impaired response 1 [Vitis vinifera]|uniref:Protein FAR-RED impaired response 1 n=1 Tax=Vitis vinifera TaxID=29760 RepID=A0A438FY57_VITVI|nr:Protein FAR-RED impaired response 1 [Vitis vinifera]
MDKGKGKEFIIDLNDEDFDYQYDSIVKNKAQLNAMRGVGMGTSQIRDYMVQQSGGYNNVGFTKKDLYNHVDADRRVHLRDGDAEGALAYLCGKSEMDPSFYYKYNVDEDNHLANLFWADSTSIVEEFECAWNDMLEMFNLHGHKWVTDIYAKRSRWAEAYLRGHFFAGMKSTQSSGSGNGTSDSGFDPRQRRHLIRAQLVSQLIRVQLVLLD